MYVRCVCVCVCVFVYWREAESGRERVRERERALSTLPISSGDSRYWVSSQLQSPGDSRYPIIVSKLHNDNTHLQNLTLFNLLAEQDSMHKFHFLIT